MQWHSVQFGDTEQVVPLCPAQHSLVQWQSHPFVGQEQLAKAVLEKVKTDNKANIRPAKIIFFFIIFLPLFN